MNTNPKIAFLKARWHADIVDQAYLGFTQSAGKWQVDSFDVPGAFELPLKAQQLAKTGAYDAIVAAAFVVDGGIYRHDFVATAVIDGLMRVMLDTGTPVFSVSLTPHHFQETPAHNIFFRDHFLTKGQEATDAVRLSLEDDNARRAA